MIPYQFKPGQSGNPGGRPRELSNMLEQVLAMKKPGGKQGRTYAQLFIEALVFG